MKTIDIEKLFNTLTPESCVLIISVDINGKPSGMVSAWHMKCSVNPPLFAVALQKVGYTHTLVQQSKEFTVAVCNKELEPAVHLFGSTHGNAVDKFAKTGLATEPAQYIKPPLVNAATMNFECSVVNEVDAGDHIIFIGKILAAYLHDGKKILYHVVDNTGTRFFKEY